MVSPLVVLCAAQAILQLDYSIVNLALKTIQGDLGFSTAGLQWVATSYALTFGSLLMLCGRLGDWVGRRRLLVAGLLVFGAASLGCGLAGSAGTLVAARFVQGIGAAMIAPTVLALLTSIYDGPRRSRALGAWAAAVAAGGTTGVIVGGLLTEYLGWRSIFFVNLPAVAVLVVLAMRVLPQSHGDRGVALDPLGAALITLAIAAMILALTNGEQHGFDSPTAWLPLGIFAALVAGFVGNERRVAEPMISFRFLAVPLRRISTLTMFLVGGIVTAYTYFIALTMQHVLGLSPAEAGFAILPSGLMMFTTSMLLAHRLIARLGLKRVMLVGLATTGVAMLSFTQIDAGTSYASGVLPGLLLNSFGMGLLFPAISIGITGNLGPHERGIAGGLVPTAQQVGAAVVLAVLATLAAAVSRQDAGSLSAGYRVGFLGALALVVACAGMVAATSFREIETPPTRASAAV